MKERNIREHNIRERLAARVASYGGTVRALSYLGRHSAPDVLVLFPLLTDHVVLLRHVHLRGSHAMIETKRPKKDATEAQKREHERLRDAGFQVLVITTPEELDAWLPPL